MKLEFFEPDDNQDNMIIVGATTAQGSIGEAKKECDECHGECWVSGKNANWPKAQYRCNRCLLSDPESLKQVHTTMADIEEFMRATGITDHDAVIKWLEAEIATRKTLAENVNRAQALLGLGKDATGALPIGTVIEKQNSEENDAHENGSTGVVEGSVFDEHLGYGYWIKWDDMPARPVFTMGRKIKRKGD